MAHRASAELLVDLLEKTVREHGSELLSELQHGNHEHADGALAGLNFDQAATEGAPNVGQFLFKTKRMAAKTYQGGSVKEITHDEFPVLEGITFYLLQLHPGGLREPHWHPNAHELQFCLSGKARVGVVAPGGRHETLEVTPGDMAFMPQGYFHYIENIGDDELRFTIGFNHASPTSIGIAESFAGIAKEPLAKTFGVPEETFASYPQGIVFIAGPR